MMYITKLFLWFHDGGVLMIPNINQAKFDDALMLTNPNQITINQANYFILLVPRSTKYKILIS